MNVDRLRRNRRRVFLSLALILIACVGGYYLRIVQNLQIPRNEKLADCTNSILTVRFPVPKGSSHFRLVLSGATNFSGLVKIRDASNTVQA
jgi:hypothetical protein